MPDRHRVRSSQPTSLSSSVTGALTCARHPGSNVRRYRTNGPHGPGVYPQCVPCGGGTPHLLAWVDATALEEPESDARLLSPSEVGVLDDAAHGLTVKQSAASRCKGSETIKSQRRSVLLKLGARNMAQAVAMTSTQGSFDPERPARRVL